MTVRPPMDLYALLPAHHRREDERRGFPLRGLLALLSREGDVVRHGFDALWDDLFIETCDRWVIPYIGDLVANQALHATDPGRGSDPYAAVFADLAGPDLRPTLAVPLRTDVAKTIYYRRRKGTAPMLEELARDVTGWGARLVEMFELLEWTQNDDHLRLSSPECAEVRGVEPIDRASGPFHTRPFDPWAHTADVRATGQDEGWHNLENAAFFLWRLGSFPLERVPARPVDPADAAEWRFHLSPLGQPAPLFTNPRPAGDSRRRAGELHLPGPVRRAFFWDDLVRYRASAARPRPDTTDLYGPLGDDHSFLVWIGGVPVPPAANPLAEPENLVPRVVCRRLDPWPAQQPSGNLVAIDPAVGRLALGEDLVVDGALEVSYHYGFAAHLGGGPYERRAWLVAAAPGEERTVGRPDPADPPEHATVAEALLAWNADGRPPRVITVRDSRTHALPALLTVPWDGSLVIQAASGERPLLVTPAAGLEIRGTALPAGEERLASLTLSGVVVEGHLRVTGELRRLRLLHAALVPGRRLDPDTGAAADAAPSLVVGGEDAGGDPINTRFRLEMAFSIAGGLRLPAAAEALLAYDSILDGARVAGTTGVAVAGPGGDDTPGPPATLERVTVLGPSRFRELPLASETIFHGVVTVERQQGGCVRFSFVPPGSVTPRRFRCQPELALADAEARADEAGEPFPAAAADAVRLRVAPCFTDVRYGQPGYAQLSLGTAGEIRTGAEDGSEMGVFAHLQQPHRETNLRIRLREYLPYGLAAGLIYVT
ncbi:MAG TPA: hypothetical protein VHQ65_12080 [Thermoanaerobaculia bacterium]|nr:hypothetical protein [Thermoanaerobaculia bacterium]